MFMVAAVEQERSRADARPGLVLARRPPMGAVEHVVVSKHARPLMADCALGLG